MSQYIRYKIIRIVVTMIASKKLGYGSLNHMSLAYSGCQGCGLWCEGFGALYSFLGLR